MLGTRRWLVLLFIFCLVPSISFAKSSHIKGYERSKGTDFWTILPDGGAKASIGKLNSGTYPFVKNSGFPKELFLALLSHESYDFDNEFVSFDYGNFLDSR